MAESTGLAERLAWVRQFEQTADAGAVCRQFDISRATLRKWWGRYEASGVAGLQDVSRTPRQSPGRKVFAPEAALIEAMRAAGLGLARIRSAMLAEHGLNISVPTIRKVLQRASGAEVSGPPTRQGKAGKVPSLFAAALPDDSLSRLLAADITRGLLRPGERLTEEALSQRYRAGRTRIRQALRSLAMLGLVVIERNRGAIVATPSHQEVADAYAARSVIEQCIVIAVACHHTPEQIDLLEQHLIWQIEAEKRGDKVELVHLLTEFHLLLASFCSNQFLRNFVETLASMTSLAVLLYDQSANPSCAIAEHRVLIENIRQGNGAAAAALMASHLGHNHHRLDLPPMRHT